MQGGAEWVKNEKNHHAKRGELKNLQVDCHPYRLIVMRVLI